MTRIRTLEFLPGIFQTPTNSQFLAATLDQLVNPPLTRKIEGYVGSRFGYGIDAKDYYVTEPTKTRTDYQLEPGVVFLKNNETTATDFISYPGILDALKLQGGFTENNDQLFESQFYSWDSFTNLDMLINYNQYYWLPEGPPAVSVASDTVFLTNDYIVQSLNNAYNIRAVGAGAGSNNPTITLIRGGSYNFIVNQDTQFWIQGEPGVTGFSPTQTNLYTRNVYGVSNNGAMSGVITFNAPSKNAQNEFNFPGNNQVGVVSNRPFSQINGARLADIGSIDSVTSLNGRTVMFYNTGVDNEVGYTSNFYAEGNYDTNYGNLVANTTSVATAISIGGALSLSNVSGLSIGSAITFTGTSFGDIEIYSTSAAANVASTSLVAGERYFITNIGTTDWISAGVNSNAVLNAQISGNVLTINSVVSGAFSIGQTLSGAGVTPGTKIVGYDAASSLAPGGLDTYFVNIPQTVATTNISVYDIEAGKLFTATGATAGTGLAKAYTPVIYYIKTIDSLTNTITISETLDGATFVPSSAASGTMTVNTNQGLFEEGFYTNINDNFYLITFIGDPADPVLKLTPYASIPVQEKIVPLYGLQYIGLGFFKNLAGAIEQIPYLSAPLDTLYYQDGTNPNKVGIIRLIESNTLNTLNVDTEILGKKNFTSTNGIVFTNGLKVEFDGDVIPTSYLTGQYYVEGVGTSIELVPVESLVVPEPFTTQTTIPYDTTGFDIGNYDAGLFIPLDQDYITIARNSINKNAWSRSNRWFHSQVISATAQYNNNPDILTEFANTNNKAKRPIIEFYPNLKLFNSGTVAKDAIDYIDTRTTDAFSDVAGQATFYPDVDSYTSYSTGCTISPNPTVTQGQFIVGEKYQITSLGTTQEPAWLLLGARQVVDGEFVPGIEYVITSLGSTTQIQWNIIAGTTTNAGSFVIGQQYQIKSVGTTNFTLIGAANNNIGTIFTATGAGTGTGVAYGGTTYAAGDFFTAAYSGEIIGSGGGIGVERLFTATNTGNFSSSELVAGLSYTITTLGTTQWQNIGASSSPTVGETFTAIASAVGTGFAVQGNGTSLARTTTEITIPSSTLVGNLSVGMYINDQIFDQQSQLPANSRILQISGSSTLNIIVNWPLPATILGTNSGDEVSFVASTKNNSDLLLFPGARIVFAAETNSLVKNKIYVANLSNTTAGSYPVLTFTEALDGDIQDNDQFTVLRGQINQGKSFYLQDDEFVTAQLKTIINQPPKFDIYDNNGISFGNEEIYESTTFTGNELFRYKLNDNGINDTVLGFPVTYSSINNVGDITFEVALNTDTFNYVTGAEQNITETQYVNTGYVYNVTSRTTFERELGWQTAVAPSTQYQIFEFEYDPSEETIASGINQNITFTVECDVPQLSISETVWPSIEVYNNNTLLVEGTDYTVTNTSTTTLVAVSLPPQIKTIVQVALLSEQVSNNAYYTIPINLSNNPFNTDLTTVDIGDIRGQYQSIFNNNPNTTGQVFGANNTRDLGNLVPYGNRIIQNSASLALPGAFLRKSQHNLFDALQYNSREYIKFKSVLIDTVNNIDWQQKYDPSSLLDAALDIITSVKNQEMPFFWSDMIPNKSPYITNTYTFFNAVDTSTYPLSKIYDFETANYDGVLVYLNTVVQGTNLTIQLYKNIDYTISIDSPSLVVTKDLQNGDKITIKEYNQTYGSYVPNTPTKLGLYPATIPKVILDDTYLQPTYFILGHDGSYNKLYGDYDINLGLIDYRDQVLLEFETRVYNNLKLSATVPVQAADIIPGYFRNNTFTYDEWLDIYSQNFLDWIGQNRLNYKTQFYINSDEYTYNYKNSGNKLNNSLILQGGWRGIYLYYYDTATPNQTPWEMIGYANQPSWWENRYGPAPYTSDNLILWTDLQDGVDYNNGDPVVIDIYKRPGLLNILPVDNQGNLVNPLISVVGNYNPNIFRKDWVVGDVGPVEYSYRRSSTWPFDLMRLQALLKPANFFNLGVDQDNYKYNSEFNQYLVNDRSHLVPANIQIYGNGTAKTSYINWIVDYEKQLGVDATDNIEKLLTNLDVRLVFRLAGFSDKRMLKFFVEKGTPDSKNASLLIPDESYQILLYENQPYDRLMYSSVIVQSDENGYRVFGNSQTTSYFKTLVPINNGNTKTINIQNQTVKIANDYTDTVKLVPYGTLFYTVQELSQFLMSYGTYLESVGASFTVVESTLEINWEQMVAEFLYWTQIGWEVGSIVTLNPAANTLIIDKESQIVQPLTVQKSNFILNQNLYTIENRDLSIQRNGTEFSVTVLNPGDTIGYGQFDLSNIEHGIVFSNKTIFNDVIYNLVSGLKQNRIYVQGTKSAEWNGTLTASGFIYNQDNIQEWQPGLKYAKGEIVKFKNKYFVALTTIQPGATFKELEWKQSDYNEIQKGLLPNSSTRSFESTLYYNSNEANLENDADALSFSLIGFRSRPYMVSADLTDITQVNVYKNLIKEKGTRAALNVFKGANLPQGGIDYEIYENWAILSGEFGGVLNNNFIEFKLNQSHLTGNPSVVGLTNGQEVPGAQQLVPLYSLFNYGRPVDSVNVLPTLTEYAPSSVFPDAGYVNYNDVKMSAYFFSQLPVAVDQSGLIVPIDRFYVNEYVWLADYLAQWQVMTPDVLGQVLQVRNNLNGTSTITFKENHGLVKSDIFAIINFDSAVNGYYVVNQVLNPTQVTIALVLSNNTKQLTGQGIAYKFSSQRVAQPSDIENLPLLATEFVKNKVWVDLNTDGGWAVYRKSINYQYDNEFNIENSTTFGSAVSYTPKGDYLFGDAGAGIVYRFQYDALTETYEQDQTFTQDISFGSTIETAQNVYAIAQPTVSPSVFIYYVNDSTVSDDIEIAATITAPVGATNFGTGMALSGDANWLFVGDYDTDSLNLRNKVHAYRRNNELIDAGSFVVGEFYKIEFLGDTDFTAIGAIENKVGIYFIVEGQGIITPQNFVPGCSYEIISLGTTTQLQWNTIAGTTGIIYAPGDVLTVVVAGTGTGTALQLTAGAGTGTAFNVGYELITTIEGPTVAPDKFGSTITSSYYGDTLVVGAPNHDYDVNIENWGKAYVYNRSVQNIETQNNSNGTTVTFDLAWTPDPLTNVIITKNGILVDPSLYNISGSNLEYSGTFKAGDIINISGNQFTLVQTLTTETNPRIGVGFSTGLDTNTMATEILVGAPFALNNVFEEGAVYRYTNAGSRFGFVVGTEDTNVTSSRKLLINGYAVTIPVGNSDLAAITINQAKITNVQAASQNGKLIISVINDDISVLNQKLVLTATNDDTFEMLGINPYTQTQVIQCPHLTGPTQFGTVVKFNEHNSVAISAPSGTRYAQTTFDFTDDENWENDLVFDNNATQFIDSYPNAGAVYLFDYLGNYAESLSNIGAYTYAQSVNDKNQNYGAEPRYGTAIDFTDYKVVIGTPDFRPEDIDGQVIVYVNPTGENNWVEYRQSNEIVNIDKIQNTQIFSAELNQTLVNLDYFDPLQGKLLGAIRQNIDVISNIDPATYNNDNNTQSGFVWGAQQLGSIWFDTTNIRFINYHQNDNEYNAKYWGTLFPGSDVAMYTWISSDVPPIEYQGAGVPRDVNLYTVQTIINSSNTIQPVYYFWVRNSGIIFNKAGKSLADINLALYLANPLGSGISYMAPIAPNAFALYNSQQYINANDSVLHIGYSTSSKDDPSHQEYQLVREDYADDFLPGFPNPSKAIFYPESLYDRMLDSLAGVDEEGGVLPDPYLPKAVQSGVLARPRQSFFYNRFKALQNYLQYANSIMKLFPITEIRPATTYLNKKGTFYDTTLYWERINWWAPGFDNNTKANIQVQYYADLSTLNVTTGTIVSVSQGNNGSSETYIYEDNGVWTRIGLTNGTIQFNQELWNYDLGETGFGDDFYGTSPYDMYPSEETRWIIRALNEQIYTNDLLIYRNKSLILLFEYIQAETVENQNYLPWLNKTSLVDVAHKIRELKPIQNFKSDNQEFLSGYVNEVKPYHVVIKEFLFEYTGEEIYQGNLTDFDLPATYNFATQSFETPELVYSQPNGDNQYLPTDSIWTLPEYEQWYNAYGVSLIGQDNYLITKTASYLTLGSDFLIVDNAQGFPINGTIKIQDVSNPSRFEVIGYSTVDRTTNTLAGLTRGLQGTEAYDHIPGENVYIDLPSVIVLDSGRNYANPPRIIAKIDLTKYPQPREEAVLEAIMSLDSVIGVNVINPGSGYAVLPEIVIDPSVTYEFTNTDITSATNTIELYAPAMQSGDLVRYVNVSGDNIGGLDDRQWYYINVLDNSPKTILALYASYTNAVKDENRVQIYSTGTGTNSFELGAKASVISSAYPVRENNITLRFDRTSYNSQVTDWVPGSYYGSFFAGSYNNTENISSSSIELESTLPPINNILASNDGLVLPLKTVSNDRQFEWSGFERFSTEILDNNIILDYESDPENENPSGSTIGFTVGMPVKFIGDVGTQLNANATYYVSEVTGSDSFTISFTQYGASIVLSNESVDMSCYTAQITDTAIVSTNYPGIRQVTQTSSTNNLIKVPLTAIGTGGTQGLYTGIPVVFTGNVFGGIEEHAVYYVNSVIDSEHFTMSETDSFVRLKALSINAANQIIMQNTTGLEVNDKIVFSNMVINGQSVNAFGNDPLVPGSGIIAGNFYYVKSIGINVITISETLGGSEFVLEPVTSDSQTYSFFVTQNDNLQVTSATGNMNINIQLPASPGQVNGQLFTFYPSSTQYANITAVTFGNLLTTDIYAAKSGANIVILDSITNMYVGLPFVVDQDIGTDISDPTVGLYAGTVYYVKQADVISLEITNTSSSTEILTTNGSTDFLYVNMPIVFSGFTFGGIVASYTYYVDSIINGTQFTIKETLTGSTKDLSTGNGAMVLTGQSYIQASLTQFGTVIEMADEVKSATFTQRITGTPIFDISYILGGYRVIINDGGQGFTLNNTILISGSLLGGASPDNDCTLTVNKINAIVPGTYSWSIPEESNGSIVDTIRSGTPNGVVNNYYLKVKTADSFEIYSDPNLTIPVSGIDFPYVGFTTTVAQSITESTDIITLADATDFNVNDPIIFTGQNFSTELTLGQVYYVYAKLSSTEIQICDEPGGTLISFDDDASGSLLATKPGSFALLPEPFYFNQSIVKYNNRVYICVISNNDDEFVFGKWEELNSGDLRLNAMDRVKGYYQPDDNMPGAELQQLFTGITYPNTTYKGNAFDPNDQYTIDTVLQDQVFYPSNVNIAAITYNGVNYIAPANLPNYTALAMDIEVTNDWLLGKFSQQNLNISDIIMASGTYIMVSRNSATPILISLDGKTWTTNGLWLPSNTPASEIFLKNIPLIKAQLSFEAIARGTRYVAVGNNISTSLSAINSTQWLETYAFPEESEGRLYDVAYVTTSYFTGYIAVGVKNDNKLIVYSNNGVNWTEVPANAFTYAAGTVSDRNLTLKSISADGNFIVAVGDNGVIYRANGLLNWTLVQVTGTNLNQVNHAAGTFVSVGNNGSLYISALGTGWTIRATGTTENLNTTFYNTDTQIWTIGGNNNTLFQTTDITAPVITWDKTQLFSIPEPTYTVKGDPFLSGYGPEELVPGVVTDQLTMIVNTRAGTNWAAEQYAHVGYNVVSTELSANPNNEYSFDNLVQVPALVSVFVMSNDLSISLYEGYDYTVDYVNKTVSLLTNISDPDMLRIDAYEVGNGDQLVKSNTQQDPLITNTITGFQETPLGCNYSAFRFTGGGVVRPTTDPVATTAIETDSSTNTIKVADVSVFALDEDIYFSGIVYGGVSENTPYYVKSINTIRSTITISDSLIAGIAGPIFELTDGSGTEMVVIAQNGPGLFYTEPAVFHNGSRLLSGITNTVIRSKSSNNAFTTYSTSGLMIGQKITFDNNIFGGLTGLTTYYVENILSETEFTVSTLPGYPAIILINALGNSTFITNDFAVKLSDDQITATMLLANIYDTEVDYISYSFFNETEPSQYGYTIPQTQVFAGNGTRGAYPLTNYLGEDNDINAIVEVNGYRINPNDYVINSGLNTLIFDSYTPTSSDTIAVTTFNDTQRQYLNTQVFIASSNQQVTAIDNVYNTITPILIDTQTTVSDGTYFTALSTTNFVNGQNVMFTVADSISTSFGGVAADGTIYTLVYSGSGNNFRVQDSDGNYYPTSVGTGLMHVVVGGQPAVRVQTSGAHNLTTNDLVRIDGLEGSVQLNGKQFYVHVISNNTFDLYQYFPEHPTEMFDYYTDAVNYPITVCDSYISGGYVWASNNWYLQTTQATEANGSDITVDSVYNLVLGTPVLFTEDGIALGSETSIVEIIAGDIYYISGIDVDNNTIKISSIRGGENLTFASISDLNIRISQWQQTNVDRLWVTVDGERVASSALRINEGNEIGILAPVVAGAEIVITSMMPSATPDELVYINIVDKNNDAAVYRANAGTRTWITEPVNEFDSIIYVDNVNDLTNKNVQTDTAPVKELGYYYIPLDANKNDIIDVAVYNNNPTRLGFIEEDWLQLEVRSDAPYIRIQEGDWIETGDILTITTLEGKLIYIRGEFMRIESVDPNTNTMEVLRGANGTSVQIYIPAYTEVYSLLDDNLLSEINYDTTWNPIPGLYNTTQGDPLQIADTNAALFLRADN